MVLESGCLAPRIKDRSKPKDNGLQYPYKMYTYKPTSSAVMGTNYKPWATIVLSIAVGLFFGFTTSLVIWGILSLLLLLYGFKSPRAALYGLLILVVLDPLIRSLLLNSSIFPLLRWNTFNYLLIGYGFFYLPLLLRLKNPQVILFGLLLIVFFASLVISLNPLQATAQILLPLSYLGVVVICGRVNLLDDSWHSLAMITSFLGLTMSSLFQITSSSYIDHNSLIHVNTGAALVGMVGYVLAVRNHRPYMIFTVLVLANSLLSLVTGSRGGIILCGIIVLCQFLLIIKTNNQSRLVLSLLILVFSIFCVVSLFPEQYSSSLTRLRKTVDSTTYSLNERTSSRSDIALGAWHIFRKNPLLGVGTGNFPHEWAKLGSLGGHLTTGQVGETVGAHGGWLLVIAENGSAGMLFLLLWVLSFARAGVREREGVVRLLGIATTILLATSLIHSGFQPKALGFLFAFCTIVLNESEVLWSISLPHSLNPVRR